MCQFKSAIVLKDKIICPLNKDSHSEILNDLGINDDYLNASKTFVRVEMIPIDGDVFNHNLDNWKLKVDQDIIPEWFDLQEAEKRMKDQCMPEVFEKCFAVNVSDWREYKDTKIYVKNAKIQTFHCSVEARGNSSVEAWGNSSVVARENSSVEAWGNSSVVARENSSVEARGNSSVEAWGNSSVVARENSSVEAWGNSSVVARENSSVEARGNSSVEAWGNSSVVARENSSVEARENSSVEAWGNSSVVARENSSVTVPYSTGIKIKGVHDNATIKDLSGNPKIIVANDFEIVKYVK